MTLPTLGIGVVGAGFIGPAHVEALRRCNFHVVGLAASAPDIASEKARQLNLKKSYTSLEEMVSDPEIDVIHIATPNYLHYPQAKTALEAGKHVICEKPLALSSQQAADLIRLARKKNRVGVVNFNLRYYPLVFQARQMVREGKLGELYTIHGSYLQDWLLLPTDWNWRLEPEQGGTLRAVADIGSHWLDMVMFVSGLKIEAVLADFKTF
ncbi:MAG: gfo/Idh/MocA family oxidoreductase, partial [Chloroflexi bacterium]